MKPTLKIRKPNVNLTTEDLHSFPSWEYAIDEEGVPGQDETWVKPVPRSVWSDEDPGVFLAADLMLANGAEHSGCLYAAFGELGPGYLLSDGEAVFVEGFIKSDHPSVKGEAGSFEEQQLEAASQLGLKPEEMFPVNWRLKVLKQGENKPIEGIIELDR